MEKEIERGRHDVPHCKAHVEKALGAVGGVTAAVADVRPRPPPSPCPGGGGRGPFKKAVEDAGCEVTSISRAEQKGAAGHSPPRLSHPCHFPDWLHRISEIYSILQINSFSFYLQALFFIKEHLL